MPPPRVRTQIRPSAERAGVDRAQVGIRLDKRLTKVLKGLSEYLEVSLNVLVEGILQHAVQAEELELQPPWRSRKARMVCADLKRAYGLDEAEAAQLLLIDPRTRGRPEVRLFLALRTGDAATALVLLLQHPHLKDDPDRDGFPPLIGAARINAVAVLAWLIEAGADPEARDPEYGDTALGWAAYYGNPEALEFLLARGCGDQHRDVDGFTVLDNARRGRDGDLAKLGVRAPPARYERVIRILEAAGATGADTGP